MTQEPRRSVQWDPKWTRAERLRLGPQNGPNWRVEEADSAFFTKADGSPVHFRYVTLDVLPPPWAGLDDVLVEKGYRSREDLARTVRGDANEEPRS